MSGTVVYYTGQLDSNKDREEKQCQILHEYHTVIHRRRTAYAVFI